MGDIWGNHTVNTSSRTHTYISCHLKYFVHIGGVAKLACVSGCPSKVGLLLCDG